MTEKEKFEAWRKDQEENYGLIELRVYPQGSFLSADPKLIGDALRDQSELLCTEEEFYKELNLWNEQIDSKPARLESGLYSDVHNREEEFYRELNEMNQAIDEGRYKEITDL
jgi:hypothetical protein